MPPLPKRQLAWAQPAQRQARRPQPTNEQLRYGSTKEEARLLLAPARLPLAQLPSQLPLAQLPSQTALMQSSPVLATTTAAKP
jgi:hypothetical protein